jgi:hypothetical protein
MWAIRHHKNDGDNGESRGHEQRRRREDDGQDKDGRDDTGMIAMALARRQEQGQGAIARIRTIEWKTKTRMAVKAPHSRCSESHCWQPSKT